MINIETLIDENEKYNIKNNIVCVGFFDAFHKIHQNIIKKTKKLALKYKASSSLITFSQKINDYLNNYNNNNIYNKKYRYFFLNNFFNLDYLFEINVNNLTIKKTCYEFCNFLKNNLKVSKIVVGQDFKFGYQNQGDVNFLKKYFGKKNVIVFKRNKNYSSSLVKENLLKANFGKVKKILKSNFNVQLIKVKDKYKISNLNLILPKSNYLIKFENKKIIQTIENNILLLKSNKEKINIEIIKKIT